MSNLIISLSNNILRLSTENKEGFQPISAQVSSEVVTDYTIKDTKGFVDVLSGLIAESYEEKLRKFSLVFLIEPQDMILKFVTVNKGIGEDVNATEQLGDKIISQIQGDLGNYNIDDLYFSYAKIAPFVYQFVAIAKQKLEKYIEVSDLLGVELKAIIPWPLALSQSIDNSDPNIFIFENDSNYVVSLSELRGIYFSESYEKEKISKELDKLVKTLSSYKRSTPINTIYTVGCEFYSLGKDYKIEAFPSDVDINGEDAQKYVLHIVAANLLEVDANFLLTQNNLLNLLPVPVERKNTALVLAGGTLSVLVLIGAIVGGIYYMNSRGEVDPNSLASGNHESSNVLSESIESTESTETTPSENENVEKEEEAPQLNKEDLKLRVENGAGVPGIAGRTRDFLSDFDYDVLSVGNADTSDRENTLITLKESKVDFKDLLIEDMRDKYEIVIDENFLDEETAYDVLVTVGSDIDRE